MAANAEKCLVPGDARLPRARRHGPDSNTRPPFPPATSPPRTHCSTWADSTAGETVMIHAAGSGLSTAGIQLAKNAGATVLATAGTDEKCERALALGADHALNNRTGDVAGFAREVTHGRGRQHGVRPRGHGTLRSRRSSDSAIHGRSGELRQLVRRRCHHSHRWDTSSTPASRSWGQTPTGPRSSGRSGTPSVQGDFEVVIDSEFALAGRRRGTGQDAGQRLLRQDRAAAVKKRSQNLDV